MRAVLLWLMALSMVVIFSLTAYATSPTLQDYYDTGDDTEVDLSDTKWLGQCFRATDDYEVVRVGLKLFCTDAHTEGLIVEIYGEDSGPDTTGDPLASGVIERADILEAESPGDWVYCDLDSGYGLVNGEDYSIVIYDAHEWPGDTIYWRDDTNSSFGAGDVGAAYYSNDSGAHWSYIDEGDEDFMFRLYGYDGLGPPENLLAIPISSTQINLTWDIGEGCEKTHIRYKTGGYPTDIADGTEIYEGDGTLFNHKGLNPGTTYYYKAWGYDEDEDVYVGWDRDVATTLMGEEGPEAPPMPGEWFQDPSCDAYASFPGYDLLINVADSFGMPYGTMCLIHTVFLVVGVSAVGFVMGGTMIGLGTMAVAIMAGSIAGLMPMWFILVALVIGITLAFAWTRA